MEVLKKEEREWQPGRLHPFMEKWTGQALWYWPGWRALGAVGQVLLLTGLFLYSGPLIRWFDPTAGVLDSGLLSLWLAALLLVDSFVVSAWLLLRLIRNTLTGFNEWGVEQDNLKKGISSCLETKLLTGLFAGLVLLFWVVFWVLL